MDKEVDERLIEISKNVRTKIDEAKARINEVEGEIERTFFRMFRRTRRGRLLLRICGIKNENERRTKRLKALRKERRHEGDY